MTDATEIATAYIAAWNEQDAGQRAMLLARAWADEACYVDPLMRGEGREEISTMIGAVQARFAGARFALRGKPEAHNDRLRFCWTLRGADGAMIAEGTDFATTAPDGRLRNVTGFLDSIAG
ncbi:MAG TPA: nuclear transport factor 2 family protein [Acetobacteraceae bacterium]|nr:nuclear transport factor 2 family protein [Acetobacteraceae bacterium]